MFTNKQDCPSITGTVLFVIILLFLRVFGKNIVLCVFLLADDCNRSLLRALAEGVVLKNALAKININ